MDIRASRVENFLKIFKRASSFNRDLRVDQQIKIVPFNCIDYNKNGLKSASLLLSKGKTFVTYHWVEVLDPLCRRGKQSVN